MSNRTIPLTDSLYDYLLEHSTRESDAARALREETQTLSERNMAIAPEQGQFMQMLARLTGARSYIEVGVFTGYSSLVMAEAMPPESRILGCDVSQTWTRNLSTRFGNNPKFPSIQCFYRLVSTISSACATNRIVTD